MKTIEAHFFKTQGGIEPVREFLKQLDQPDRESVGEDIATVEHGWPLGMPTCRPLGNGTLASTKQYLQQTNCQGYFLYREPVNPFTPRLH